MAKHRIRLVAAVGYVLWILYGPHLILLIF